MTPHNNPQASLPKKKRAGKKNKEPESFGQKEVHFSEIFYLPDGLENLFLGIYFITIPYVTGLIFLFGFAAKGKIQDFMQLDLAMFFVVWAIGYEVVGGIALVFIFYNMFTFKKGSNTKQRPQFKQRSKDTIYEVHKFD